MKEASILFDDFFPFWARFHNVCQVWKFKLGALQIFFSAKTTVFSCVPYPINFPFPVLGSLSQRLSSVEIQTRCTANTFSAKTTFFSCVLNIMNFLCTYEIRQSSKYRGFLPYATFGTWKTSH